MLAISSPSAPSAIAIGASVLRFILRFFMLTLYMIAVITMPLGDWFERQSFKI